MRSVVYADILIFMNTIITFIILLTTADFLKIEPNRIRYVTGSLIGGVFSLIIIAPQMNTFLMLLSRTLIGVLIVLISFNLKNFRVVLKCIICFVFITFLYSGVLYFVLSFINSDSLYINNGYIYFDLSAFAVIGISALIFCILKFINCFILKKKDSDLIFNVIIIFNEKKIKVKAFFDTGNSIKDNFTDRPVILVSISEISELVDSELYKSLEQLLVQDSYSNFNNNLRLIPVKTLGEYNVLPAFTADKAIVEDYISNLTIDKPCIAVCYDSFDDKNYKALINKEVLGRVI